MSAPAPSLDLAALARRIALIELYQAYAECLDSGNLADWPGFFTERGAYRAQGRENFDRGLPMTAMTCEGRSMFEDRVTVIAKIMVYVPRTVRHVVATPRVLSDSGGVLRAQASFCIFHTLAHEPTALLSVGRYEDQIVEEGGALKFKERLAIYDSLLIPNSLVYPL